MGSLSSLSIHSFNIFFVSRHLVFSASSFFLILSLVSMVIESFEMSWPSRLMSFIFASILSSSSHRSCGENKATPWHYLCFWTKAIRISSFHLIINLKNIYHRHKITRKFRELLIFKNRENTHLYIFLSFPISGRRPSEPIIFKDQQTLGIDHHEIRLNSAKSPYFNLRVKKH